MESRILSGKYIDWCGFELKFGFLSVHLLALPVMFVQKRMCSNLSFFLLWLNSFRFQQNNFSSFIGHSDRNCYALERFVASVFSLHWVEADLSMPTALSQRYVSLLFNKFLGSDSWGLQDTCLLVTTMTSVSTLIGEDTNDLCVPSKHWFIRFGLLVSTRQCAASSHLLSRWDVALPSFRLSHRSERVVSTLSCQERLFLWILLGCYFFLKLWIYLKRIVT